MKKYDVVTVGELLIDFTQNGQDDAGHDLYAANPGGAPGNVMAMLNNLGRKVAFVGKVGNDSFGHLLKDTLKSVGIDDTYVTFDEEVHTTLAFVHTFEGGERDFSFYRNPGADVMLKAEDIPLDVIDDTKCFHFGTLSMTHEGVREATKLAVSTAKKSGAIISFDPNLREPLWKSLDEAKEQFAWGMSMCDILKISDNEIKWFTGIEDYTKAVAEINKRFNIPLILVSMGPGGSRAYSEDRFVEVKAYKNPATIETTGAGDTFCACVIDYVLDNGLNLSDAKLTEMLRRANAAASIITTRRGALSVMPTGEEIEKMLSRLA